MVGLREVAARGSAGSPWMGQRMASRLCLRATRRWCPGTSRSTLDQEGLCWGSASAQGLAQRAALSMSSHRMSEMALNREGWWWSAAGGDADTRSRSSCPARGQRRDRAGHKRQDQLRDMCSAGTHREPESSPES